MTSRIAPKRRLESKNDALAEKHGTWQNKRTQSAETLSKRRPRSSHFRWIGGCLLRPELEDRYLVVDSGASKHMLSSAELETVRVTRRPTTVIAASGSIETKEEALVHVRDLDLFVTAHLRDDTPPVLSLWKLCEDYGCSYE